MTIRFKFHIIRYCTFISPLIVSKSYPCRSFGRSINTKSNGGGKKNKRNQAWLDRHTNDPYVRAVNRNKTVDLRSRSAFKLLELQEKHRFIDPKRHKAFIDLGAAPGGWSVTLSTKILAQWRKNSEDGIYSIHAVDLLPMDSIPNVHFIQGDIRSAATREVLVTHARNKSSPSSSYQQQQLQVFDVVLSDILHNTTGQRDVDHYRSMEISQIVLNFCDQHLRRGGNLLCKFYQGADDREFQRNAKSIFRKVKFVKPKSSRSESREMYLLATERM